MNDERGRKKIFISYRRADSAGHAQRLYERLLECYDDKVLFFDEQHIDSGDHFPTRIDQALDDACVVLILIGPDWSKEIIERSLDPRKIDYVREEIRRALDLRKSGGTLLVIPVLLYGAQMPNVCDLPEPLCSALIGLDELHAHSFSDRSQKERNREFERLLAIIAGAPGAPDQRDRHSLALPSGWSGWRPNSLAQMEFPEGGFVGRSWLIDEVERWAASDERRPLLLLAGFGMGKTATAAELIRRWKELNHRVVSHFCRFNHDETLKPGAIVANIAAQLAALLPEYRQAVETNKHLCGLLDQSEDRPTVALKDAVFDPLCSIGHRTSQSPCYVIIDGLDESLEIASAPGQGSANATTLVDLVTDESIRIPDWIRILLISRPIDRLKRDGVRQHFKTVNFDEAAARQGMTDITQYVLCRAANEPPLQNFLQHAGRSAQELAAKLIGGREGRFLLAKYVLDDIVRGHIDPTLFDRLPQKVGAFYERSFLQRIAKFNLDTGRVRELLGLIAVVRTPLPPSILADILPAATEAEIRTIYDAFGGLLQREGNNGGVKFSHLSLEEWLDNEVPNAETPIEYQIRRKSAEEHMFRYCQRMATQSLEQAGEFRYYLQEYGIRHLIEGRDFACAHQLLASLRSKIMYLRQIGLAKSEEATELEQICAKRTDLVVDRMRRQWQEIDAGVGGNRERERSRLEAVSPEYLKGLLFGKDYLTGKYVPVIRTLIDCHSNQWSTFKEELLGSDDENDIVFRHDAGVAYAQTWRFSGMAARNRLKTEIDAMARDESPDVREIAGYALKYICERTDARNWWRPALGWIKPLSRTLAHSEHATDRMVAGEMLLALAVQGEKVMNWFGDDEDQVPFWKPYWPNHRADINAIRALCGAAVQGESDDGPESLASCLTMSEMAATLSTELKTSPLFQPGGACADFAGFLDGNLAQQSRPEPFDFAAVRKLAKVLQGPSGGEALKFVRYLMLHPLWNMTERAATLLADIVKRDPNRLNVIEEMANSAGSAWRICYGALDAAYCCGHLDKDEYATFFRLLILHGRDPSARVRGICIDDLNGWIRDADSDALEARMRDEELVALLRFWLQNADDIWLLEYLHEMFRDLQSIHGWDEERIAELMGPAASQLTPFIPTPTFYQQDAADFMAQVEGLRMKEWAARHRRLN